MLNKLILMFSIIASAIVIAMLFLTNPTAVGPLGVLVLFLATYVVMFGITTFIVWLFSRFVFRKKRMTRHDYLYAAVIGFAPVVLLVVNTAGTSNLIISGAVTMIMVLGGCLLVKKRF